MSIAVLTRRLLDLGATAEMIGVAVEAVTLASADRPQMSRDASADSRRERDRIRKRTWRKNLKIQRLKEAAQANDGAANVPRTSADASADATNALLLTLNKQKPSDEGSEENKKARKQDKSEDTRARGTRMVAGAILTDEYHAAAVKLGADPARIPDMWAEFVDYWTGVPGSRGLKSNWLGTWRNRVREVLSRGNRNGYGRPVQADKSVSAAADRILERMRSFDRPVAEDRRGDGGFTGQNPRRLLSQG